MKRGFQRNTVNKRIIEFIKTGILPSENVLEFSDIQKQIYEDITTFDGEIRLLIYKYLDYANNTHKQLYLHKKITSKEGSEFYKNKGMTFNIFPEDIIINEYCPFFNTKIKYGSSQKSRGLNDSEFYSIDRIDNSKGYIKGNAWIISRLANRIKLDATTDELKRFCKNVLLLYVEKQKIL